MPPTSPNPALTKFIHLHLFNASTIPCSPNLSLLLSFLEAAMRAWLVFVIATCVQPRVASVDAAAVAKPAHLPGWR